jgi:peptidyl-prolyl cis-trans isomerase B (cyclophilin B)
VVVALEFYHGNYTRPAEVVSNKLKTERSKLKTRVISFVFSFQFLPFSFFENFIRPRKYEKLQTMRSTIIAVLAVLLLASIARAQQPTPPKANPRPTPAPTGPKPEPFEKADVKTMAAQCVTLDTEAGTIELELFPESAPESVRNFLNLSSLGYFNGTSFSRVVPGFVIQGGNMWSVEGGKVLHSVAARATRTIPDEPSKILHERGILSMARTDEPNKASSDFFILVEAAPSLDGKFSAFGRVTKGMEVVDAINKAPVTDEKPEKPVRVRKVIVAVCPAK